MNTISRLTIAFMLLLGTISSISGDEELILVHVVFRHGHRTPDEDSIYPNDPYRNETYYPYGLGQLTNEGKLHEYNLGQYLRQRYNTFLDDIYTPDLIDARSSGYNRTKMSLDLVLAGLFPPNDDQTWLKGMPWQPIPYNYWPKRHDEVLLGLFCPSCTKYAKQYEDTAEYQRKHAEFREFFEYIEANTGLTNVSFYEIMNLYWCLETEREWGFVLPEWTKTIYPNTLREAAMNFYHIRSATTSLKKLVSGYLLQKIVDDSVAKINGTLTSQIRKMFLYSGHEVNVAFFMRTLGLNIQEMPPYGSAIIVELHQINGIYGFKIYYENSLNEEPILLNLPKCGQFCPIDLFKYLYEQYFDDASFCYN